VSLERADGYIVLDLRDDGVGFDSAAVVENPPDGHFGLRVLGDVAADAGADLRVASAPGQGTWWQLRVPVP
jgi:signal transduction histidine kinase